MTEYGKTRIVFITGTRKPHAVHHENDRRPQQVSGSSQHRTIVRRGSIDSASIMRTRPIVVTRGHSVYEPRAEIRDRRPPVIHVTGRENGLRKQATAPKATPVTPVTELKSILKRTNSDLTSLKQKEDSDTEQTADQNGLPDPKCCYRLPDQTGNGTLRKSVSFREDQMYGSRRTQRHVKSPRMSLPKFWIKGFEKSQEFFV